MADYLLGMSAAEIDRLRRQHETWQADTEHVWRRAGFRAGHTIVDLGCGPGFTSLALAAWVGPTGRVVAVDASAVATDHLRATLTLEPRANVEIVTHDVCALDLRPWKPHGLFARWLFSFLPAPEEIVARLAANLEPGTTVAAMDYWNYRAISSQP